MGYSDHDWRPSMHASTARGVRLALQTFSILLLVVPAFAQRGSNPASASTGSTGVATTTVRGAMTTPNPSTTNNGGTINNQPTFISGQVLFSDGSAPNPN